MKDVGESGGEVWMVKAEVGVTERKRWGLVR